MGTLYVIATPIGNLHDISARAISVLKEVYVIAAEDTRVSKRLLMEYGVSTPMISYHAQSKDSARDGIVKRLAEGNDVALITDAGTPGISDPGTELVRFARDAGFSVVTVPGPSALTAALSIAGIPTNQFTFLGFLPHKKGRETLFKEISESDRTMVFYESPHRIMKTLLRLSELLGEDKRISIFRELTKIHEEVVEGSAAEVLQYFVENEEHIRGEFVVAVSSK
ncbi:MAG: 16S rRNA (cytidine(1402)-2'-O)-methyltransferase [Patescibacteria group bacterium UBA2103]